MSTGTEKTIIGLATRYIDQQLTAEELAELDRAVQEDPDARRLFLEFTRMNSALYWQPDLLPKAAGAPTQRIVWKRLLAAAAGIALVASLLHWQNLPPPGSGSYARVAYIEPVAAGEQRPLHGANLMGREIAFETGVMQIEFSSGAIVAIEAPARFSIEDELGMTLHRGKLSAWCPPSAQRFAVRTPHAKYIDLGTTFGVQADEGGKSSSSVFSGEVVCSPYAPSEPSRLLYEGDALSVDGHSVEKIDFDGLPYSKTWAIAAGIMQTRGAVKPTPPDVLGRLAAYQDNQSLQILPERRNVRLAAPLMVNLDRTGRYEAADHEEVETSQLNAFAWTPPPGQAVRSHLLQFNPVKSDSKTPADWEGHHIHFTGSVSFDTEILAVITSWVALRDSNEFLGHSEVAFPPLSGLERNTDHDPADIVEIGADRRTLSVDIHTGPAIDRIRIITAEKQGAHAPKPE